MNEIRRPSHFPAHLVGLALLCSSWLAMGLRAQTPMPQSRPEPVFVVHQIGTDHAEGVTVIDMNQDGWPDIVSGAYWYQNPGPQGGAWQRHRFRNLAPEVPSAPKGAPPAPKGTHGFWDEFVADNGDFAIDVNHDGRPDLVTSSWQDDGIYWYENPGKTGVLWTPHLICHSVETEGMVYANLDGGPGILAAHYGRSGIIWISFKGPKPVVHYIGGHDQDGHGVGVADVDGDGKPDVLTIHGWFKNIDAEHDKWEWHPDWELGDTGFPILGYDVNHDGKLDLIYGHGHNYGLYWLEQGLQNGKRTWTRHTIDASFSQAHALALADIDGDGQPELITGKRYRGHNGQDPGSYEPLVVYYYKIDPTTHAFTRYTLSYNGTAGVGAQIVVTDLDKDGDPDIVVAGKTGVHWFENLKVNHVPRSAREKELYYNYDWPFPGETTGLAIESPAPPNAPDQP